jgi:hypothetical protein
MFAGEETIAGEETFGDGDNFGDFVDDTIPHIIGSTGGVMSRAGPDG